MFLASAALKSIHSLRVVFEYGEDLVHRSPWKNITDMLCRVEFLYIYEVEFGTNLNHQSVLSAYLP